MTVPGFNAEVSLYQAAGCYYTTSAWYRTATGDSTFRDGVLPAQFHCCSACDDVCSACDNCDPSECPPRNPRCCVGVCRQCLLCSRGCCDCTSSSTKCCRQNCPTTPAIPC